MSVGSLLGAKALLALSGLGALAAGAVVVHTMTSSAPATISACVQRNGTMRFATAASDCRAHEDFLTWNVQGAKGDQGAQGATGPQGAQGAQGAAGPAGPRGVAGPAGPMGANGATGPTGAQGSPGATGPQGPTGPQGATGPRGPQGPAGTPDARFGNNTEPFFGGPTQEGCILGEVRLFAGTVGGGHAADGSLLQISQNTALFSLIGTMYGGDGRTTFALPDLRGSAPNGLNYTICTVGIYPSRS
jgi:hypothetical protein